ncbi:hypothetical protein ACSDQ9_12515 [Aestuariimicrobium soli]|uniref:hypothetical protein n=1 Tax=Aestuariimicrobium soli TaxID=2035834 RepID=UPI003EBD0D7B
MAGDAPVSAAPEVPHHHAAFMRPGTAPVTAGGASLTAGDVGTADEASPTQDDLSARTEGTADALASADALTRGSHLADEAVSSRAGFVEPATPATPEPAAPESATPDDDDHLVSGRRHGFGPGLKLVAAVAALAVAGGVFFGVREFTRRPAASTTVTASTSASSATPTPSAPPALTSEMLLTAADATKALGAQGWQETKTLETIPATAPGITCMSNRQGLPNATITRQRGLVSTATTKTAILQRSDAYADAKQAQQAYDITYAALAACNDVPAFISSADSIMHAADESFSVTVAFQDDPLQYHTVIIARTGVTVTMIDGANDTTKLETQKLLDAVTPTLTRISAASKGTAPASPSARVTAVPSTPILGWLVESDIPRITAGQGRWNSTEPAKVTTQGSGCENMTLATVAGPADRKQRSYLLNQDDAAPDQFGIDEVLLGFRDAKSATAFAKKLTDNIDGCAKRESDTAKVTGGTVLFITGQDRAPVNGKVWLVEQATGANTKVLYRVGVNVAGTRVSYTISKVTPSFDFPGDSWRQLNARAGQRSTHTR